MARSPLRLLIVDDEEDLRDTLLRRFQQLGASACAAASGEEALAKAKEERFDVALLDLHLPGMSGLDLLGHLKEQQPDLEAILLTAHSSVETAIQAMKQGAYDYLKKPFQLAELEIHVQKAYEKAQLARR
jgi:two-component system, NtrC family, response regulator AtoC